MKVTDLTKHVLACRRFDSEMLAKGYEKIDGNGSGNLWEIARGGRRDHVITDAVIEPGGKAVWLKIEKKGKAK